MKDAAIMSRYETLYDLKRVFKRQAKGQCSFHKPLAKGLAFQQLTDDVRSSFVETEVINSDDIGMIESPGGAGLYFETTEMVGVAAAAWTNELQGNVALQPFVSGPENLAHGTGPDFLEDPVVSYNSAIHVQGRPGGMLGVYVLCSQ